MGFFAIPEPLPEDDLEADEDEDGFDGMRPAAWIAGVVPVELLVARSDQAAVVVSRISVYPDGMALNVDSYLHRSVKSGRRRHLHHPMMWHELGEPGEPVPGELLRFGLAWPDGGRATNIDHWGRTRPDADAPVHGLEPKGGGGSDREHSQVVWAWPLPGTGDLRVVVEWPAFGIDETTVPIDGGMLGEAARRARPVWPEDADKASHLSWQALMRAGHERGRGPGDGPPDA